MSTELEARYRKVLSMLPRGYREEHREEMLAVLMDGAGEGQVRPKAREVLSVGALAVRLRAGRSRDGSGVMAADILRRAVLAYLVLDFGFHAELYAYGVRFGFFFVPVLLQAGAIVALAAGWSWIGRGLCVAYAGYLLYNNQWWEWQYNRFNWFVFGFYVLPVAILLAAAVVFHHRAPRVAGTRWWLLALAAVTAAFVIRGKTISRVDEFNLGFTHAPALPALIYVAATLAALWLARRSPVWPAALALAGAPVMGSFAVVHATWQPGLPWSDSARNEFYVRLAVYSEFVLLATAVVALMIRLYQRRAVGGAASAA